MANLLYTPHWNAKNIASYVGCGLTKAYEIMETCRKEYDGAIKHLPSCVKRDSVMSYLGTTAEREIKLLKEGGSR